MRELIAQIPYLDLGALSASLKTALPGRALGVSASIGAGGRVMSKGNPDANGDTIITYAQVRLIMDDSATEDDEATALSLAEAHDPVFLSVDKLSIAADGVDTAVVTVAAPKADAAAVALLVNGVVVPVTLTDGLGIGLAHVTALDPTTITVSVQDGANRSADSLTIRAV